MSVNEQIAQIMGWECEDDIGPQIYWHQIIRADHLLKKMVDDGWHVHIYFVKGQPVQAEAFRAKPRGKELSEKDTEPAAIVDLFCKVYGIKGEIT